MVTATLVDVCRGCHHEQTEHSNWNGCNHTLNGRGEAFQCVCQGFED
jgi:hypothetical protein